MKVWQKIFILTLTISVVFLNVAVFLVVQLSFREELKNVKDRAAVDQQFICSSFARDLNSMQGSGTLTYDAISNNFSIYQDYYMDQGIYLELWNNGNLFSDSQLLILGERKELEVDELSQNILMREVNGQTYLFVSSKLPKPNQSYTIVVASSIQYLLDSKSNMIKITIIIDIAFMLVLAVVLWLSIKRIMKPLSILSAVTKNITSGNYSESVQINSKDELGELAEQFNKMSQSIKEKIEALKNESNHRKMLVDNMAHELKTPLTAIHGYIQYLSMAKVSEEERYEVLHNTSLEINRLNKLVTTLLMMARIREEHIEYQEVKVSDLIKNMKYLFDLRVAQREISLTFLSETECMNCNKEMIEMLLSNLIENAMRASEDGGNIEVKFLKYLNGTLIQIKDNGIGMDKSELNKVLEPFYRVDKMRSRKNGGVGLGLSLCKQVIEYHKGQINIDSELGEGTTVSIYFTT